MIYKDISGNHISKEQAEALERYWKCYYSNDVLVYEESYHNGVLHTLDYHNNDGIEHQALLSQIIDPKYNEFNIIDYDENLPEGILA